MTENEQLRPCPFCGGDNVEIIEHDDVPADLYTCTVCHYCEDGSTICFSGDTKQEAINKWNTRAISADEKEQIGRLKAFVNNLFDDRGSGVSHHCFESIEDDAIDQGLIESEEIDGDLYYKKADWLKDENEQS